MSRLHTPQQHKPSPAPLLPTNTQSKLILKSLTHTTTDSPSTTKIHEITKESLQQLNKATNNAFSPVIDILGKNSSMAQNLPHIITTSAKFERNLEGQVIYLGVVRDSTLHSDTKDESKKEFSSNAVALLKTGIKHLFFRDHLGTYHESDVLCVLDFYVHEDYQRRGIGKMLFDAMMQRLNREWHEEQQGGSTQQSVRSKASSSMSLSSSERLGMGHGTNKTLSKIFAHVQDRIEARHLAYDRPSPKLLGFLQKYYSLHKYPPQANNYVVFDEYFEALSGGKSLARSSSKVSNTDMQSVSQRPLSGGKSLVVQKAKTTEVYDPITNQVRQVGAVVVSASGSSTSTSTTNTSAPNTDALASQLSKLSLTSSPQKAARMMRDFYNTRPRPF